ncbi:MAG TPA: NnrU family protein [Caulobacteraceae bacterium]
MTVLIAAALAFILLHLLVSGTRVRDALTGAIGQGPYMGLFSLASLGLIVWMSMAYGAAQRGGGNPVYWGASALTKEIQLGLMLVAFLLVVPGLTTPNPTSVRQEGALDRPDVVKGMLRITRHPFLWGVAVWAAGHLMVNGDVASLILFGALLVLAVFGTASIDAKRKRALGETWDAFARQTSNVPFAAVITGRQSFGVAQIAEIGWWRILLAVALWVGMIFLHPIAFGANPLP